MNYLLVMPKKLGSIDHFNIFPLGLAYVSAALKQSGYSVFTANLEFLEGDTHSILQELLTENHIDVLCTGGLSRDCHKIMQVIQSAREINPGIITVVGGGIISSDPEPAMRVIDAEIGVIGEGEITMCELASALDNGQPYHNVPGLIYKDDKNALITTPPRKEVQDIDSIPFPDFDGFDYAQWLRSCGLSGLVLSDRSCPFHCTFCYHPTGEKYRQRSLDNIFSEIDYQIEKYDLKGLGLGSELFATSKQRVVEFCNRIREYNIPWGCCLRACDVDADMLQVMKASGCVSITVGLESADNSVLKSMRKGITVEQIERALKLTYEANLMIDGGFIFGDINETNETVTNTLSFWRQHNEMHYLNLTMIYVFPGSYLYEHACNTGIIENRERFLRDGCPLVNVSRLSDTEYTALTSLITELRLHPHVPAGSFQIREIFHNGECEVEMVCRKCGDRSKSRMMFWFGQEVKCSCCGLTNTVDPFQKAIHSQDIFFEHLPVGQTMALWGAGGIFYKLIHKYSMLSSEAFLLVDANKSKQGLSICNKQVYSPDIIYHNEIETVIITALSQCDQIAATLRSRYPSIEHIVIPAFDITVEGVVPRLKAL